MTVKQLLFAAALGTSTLLVSAAVDPTVARAQSSTTGAIQGAVTDESTGEKLAGVTVIATSAQLQGTQTAITDENGFYKITSLPPGTYLVTFYYADITVEHNNVNVGVEKTTSVFQKLNQANAGGEVVKITASAPTIDPTSTSQGITIDKNYIKNIPVPGRTFEAALGAAAGSQSDGVGVSFSGSSSLENQYYVDGVNTTGLTYGTVGSPVINDFIEEIEVITGGYNAEYGRATGGVVNVVTKSGSNEFKGSVFGYWQPGQLTAAAQATPVNAGSIDIIGNTAYNADFGFELGGPIIKDKLWFFVGFAPQFAKTDYTRTTKSRTDCRATNPDGTLTECINKSTQQGGYADGVPDVDPKTGFYLTDKLDQETRSSSGTGYNILGKLNYAMNPENQGQLTFQALPSNSTTPGLEGLATTGYKQKVLTTDLSAKWTSKFNDNKTEIEAILGWHRDHVEVDSNDPASQNDVRQVLELGDLGTWATGFGGESMATTQGCQNGGSADKYPNIQNCPMDTRAYTVGGPGGLSRDTEQRFSAKLNVTERFKAAGSHELKAGIDIEDNRSNKTRLLSGGATVENLVGNKQIVINRYVQLANKLMPPDDPRFDNSCNTPDPSGSAGGGKQGNLNYLCDYLSGTPGSPGTTVGGETFNVGGYIRDSWQIQPNLTLNAGLRYEEQRLRYADFLQGTVDPATGETIPKNAITLTGMLAPRIGLLYDWTKEGRSKVYAHWGRFYESIPMDINDRELGGEVLYRQVYDTSGGACGATDPRIGGPNGEGCLTSNKAAAQEQLFGAGGTTIEPGLKAQYLDEIIGGFEYEILDDLKVGVSYQNRRLGRVIEDLSVDGANSYIITNPGQFSTDEENKLIQQIMRTDDPTAKARLQGQLNAYTKIRNFDPPTRSYNALQFTLTRRFSKKLYVQGSYTYSKTEGNYPGLISYDNGQIDPNISSQYDLIELLANHYGPLPQDRPHYIKLDGYYTFDFGKKGALTTGIRLRALSGIPENALGAHYLYGPNESFLLPRGELGRTDFEHGLDIHVGYSKNLNKNMNLEVFFDIYNVYDRQGTFFVDDTYAEQGKLNGGLQNANPISGGTYQDLIWLKVFDRNGNESSEPIGRNPNFHNTTARYSPAYGRIGVRLTF